MTDLHADTRLAEAIEAFREMLSLCWTRIEAAAARSGDPSFLDDWAQATWEFLVERAFPAEARIFLEVYGAGADLHGASSRVSLPEAVPTHGIYCRPREGAAVLDRLSGLEVELQPEESLFEELVAWDGAWYRSAPPFDHVLVTRREGAPLVLPIERLHFELRPSERP